MSFIKHLELINLPARPEVLGTSIYTETYTQSGILGLRAAVLFVPGGPGNDHTTCDYNGRSLADYLVPYVDVIMFDPRGCGQSAPCPVEECTLSHYINDIEALRDHFKIPPANFILMGASYGAIAALGYAIKYTSFIHKLILICGAASGEFIDEARRNLAARGTPAQRAMGEHILTGSFTLSEDTVANYYETMGPLYSVSFKPGMPSPAIVFNAELANLAFRAFLKTFDYRSNLSDVTCPTLILSGAEDWLTDKKQALLLHQGIAASTLINYDACGHMIWMDQWDLFLNDLIRFIQGD